MIVNSDKDVNLSMEPMPYRLVGTPVTVSLVSRVLSFFCDGRMVEINTSIESDWSTKLKSITFDLNRVHLDELEQILDSAPRSVNRFL